MNAIAGHRVGPSRIYYTIAWITTALFVLITLTANGPSTYRFAILFLGPLLWGLLAAREKLALAPAHFSLLAIALLFHNLGAYGFYRSSWMGIEFDGYVHYFFGLAGGFAIARALGYNFQLTGWRLWIGALLLILGIGAVHELIEFMSTLALGPEKGMLKWSDGDFFDTQKDLLNNMLGTLSALGFYGAAARSPANFRSLFWNADEPLHEEDASAIVPA